MVTRFTASFVVLALLLLTASQSQAQPGGGPPGGGPPGFDRGMGGIGMLLMNDAVREEIAVEQAQMDELQALRDDMRDQMRQRFESMRDLPPEERRDAFQNMRSEMENLRADVEGRLQGILTEGQMSRLQQIEVQQQVQRGGSRALLQGDIAEKLGITPEQQEEMRKKAEVEEAKLREQIQKLTLEARERVLTVLTDAQRAQLKDMMGEQFDMPAPRPGQGFRGRGQGGPPRRQARPELE